MQWSLKIKYNKIREPLLQGSFLLQIHWEKTHLVIVQSFISSTVIVISFLLLTTQSQLLYLHERPLNLALYLYYVCIGPLPEGKCTNPAIGKRAHVTVLFMFLESKWESLGWFASYPNPLSNNEQCGERINHFQFSCYLAIAVTLRQRNIKGWISN